MIDETLKHLVEKYAIGDLLSRRVLIVDDDEPNLGVLGAILESEYKVETAASGDDALGIVDALRSSSTGEPFLDVIIADQRMPGMTGVELLETVSRQHPDTAGIVLTGYTDSDAIIAAINRAGAFRFLTKPASPEEIRMAVADAEAYVYQRRAIEKLVSLLAQRNEELAKALEDLRLAQDRMLHMERLSTMGRLTAGITHDVRNFLQGVTALEEELAVHPDIPEDLRETAKVCLAGMTNLVNTLEAMTQFARGDSLSADLRPTNLMDVIKDALLVMRGDVEFRKRKVSVQVQEGLPLIMADHQRLVQALVNLLRNAVQATQAQGSIWITAYVDESGFPHLAVEDQGKGVPEDVRARLFEPFVTTKSREGIGLGLYMVKTIADALRATVRCESGANGTRFSLTFEGAKNGR